MPNAANAPVTKSSSFLSEGWRELKRNLERRSLRSKMAQHDRERLAVLGRLGQRAWEAGVDLSEFAELSGQIKAVEARSGELTSTTQRLEKEKAAGEANRQNQVARFDAQRKALDDLKRPVDTSLRDLSQQQGNHQREVQRFESRLATIAGELASIEKQGAAPSTAGQTPQATEARKQQLLTEQSQIQVALPQTKQAAESLTPEIMRLTQESQRYGNEIAKLESERKATLAQIDSALDSVRGQIRATGQQSQAAGAERQNRFVQLGTAVYEKKKDNPALAEAVQQVRKAEDDAAAAAAALRTSLGLTNAMPRGTLAKFFLTIIGIPLLIIAAIPVGLYLREYYRPDEVIAIPKPINRYLEHSLKANEAYVLANQMVEAKSEQEVVEKFKQALKKIHVGIYTPDGKQILAGAERNQNDFYLYDFQVKVLARAFFLRNGMVMANHTRMLGKAFLKLDEPSEMEPVLNSAIERRYQEAQQKPDDPKNFVVLLMDGLARQQVEPYSLNETHRYERVSVDPIQSFLIMLEFFTHPPAPKLPASSSLNWFPSLVTTAYAQGAKHPCDDILGDEGQGYWGRGTDAFTEIGQAIPKWGGKAVEFIGDATGIFGAMGDLLILYGMNITLTPNPYTIHLLHGDGSDVRLLNVKAIVTFDSQGVDEDILKCGWIVGKQLPSNGPLKDVELKWDFYPDLNAPPRYLLHMSSEMLKPPPKIIASSEGLRTLTDSAGTSIFMIEPNNCAYKRGTVLEQDYLAKVTARYVTRSIPSPTQLGFGLILKMGPGAIEYLMNGRNAYTRFYARWHEKKPEKQHY